MYTLTQKDYDGLRAQVCPIYRSVIIHVHRSRQYECNHRRGNDIKFTASAVKFTVDQIVHRLHVRCPRDRYK